jgi:hypothetical protein
MPQNNERNPNWSPLRPEGFQLITTQFVPDLPAERVSDGEVVALSLGAGQRITDITSTQYQAVPGGVTLYQGLVRTNNELYKVTIKNIRLEGPEFVKMGGRRTRRRRRTSRRRK